MRECRYKKRLQFYLDGWIDDGGCRDIEKHLKHCAECQIELAGFEELTGAALDVINQAPDREYWESFNIRVRNRILSRNLSPVKIEPKAPRFLSLGLASIFVVLLAFGMLTLRFIRTETHKPSSSESMASVQKEQITIRGDETDFGLETATPATPTAAVKSPLTSNGNSGGAPTKLSESPAVSETPSSPQKSIVRDMAGPIGKSSDELFQLEIRDPSDLFRIASSAPKIQARPDLGNRPIFMASRQTVVNPSFRIRNSVIDQRILASLNIDTQNGHAISYKNPLFSASAAGLSGGWSESVNDVSSTWGYLQAATDTSKSSDIKRYFIELELMQTK